MPTTTTGVATTFIDFTRASNATVTDSDGKVKWAPANLLTNSESFDAASWLKVGGAVTANTTVAPNGTTTADTYTAAASSARHCFLVSSGIAIPTSAQHTASVYLKKGNYNYVTVVFLSLAASGYWTAATVDFSGATPVISKTQTSASSTALTPTIESAANGFWRVSLTGTLNNTTVSVEVALASSATPTYDSFGEEVWTAAGTETVIAWGASLYRSDLGGMQPNTSAYPMYNPTTPKNLLGYTESLTAGWTGTNGVLQGNGAELVTNGDFSSGTGWTVGSGWAISGGTLNYSGGYNVSYFTAASNAFVSGRYYKVTLTVSGNTSGNVNAYLNVPNNGALNPVNISGDGEKNFLLLAGVTCNGFHLVGNSATGAMSIDNISVQEVAAYEAPNGLQTARAVNATAANGTLLSSISLLASPYTFSIWLKRKTGGGNVQLTVDGTTYATVAVTDTWTRFSTTLTPTAGTKTPGIRLVTSGDAVYAWGAQLSDSASLDTYVPVYGAAVTSAAYYGPRRDFDPVTLACKGLLVEEQRVNTIVGSANFSGGGTGWVLDGASLTASATAGPDGSLSATSIVQGTGNNRTYQFDNSSVTGSKVFSIYVKPNAGSSLSITAVGGMSPNGPAVINATTGAVTGFTGASSVAVGNGWYRVFLPVTVSVASGGGTYWVISGPASSVFIWGAQLEAGTFATSYIPTIASATRNADVASVSTQAFPYNQSEGSVVVNATLGNTSTNGPVALTINDGTGSNEIYILQTVGTGTRRSVLIYVGGVPQATLAESLTNTVGLTTKVAGAFKLNDVAGSIDGGTVVTDTPPATIPTVNTMRIGNVAAGSQAFNGWIRQITYLPRRISNADLVTRST